MGTGAEAAPPLLRNLSRIKKTFAWLAALGSIHPAVEKEPVRNLPCYSSSTLRTNAVSTFKVPPEKSFFPDIRFYKLNIVTLHRVTILSL